MSAGESSFWTLFYTCVDLFTVFVERLVETRKYHLRCEIALLDADWIQSKYCGVTVYERLSMKLMSVEFGRGWPYFMIPHKYPSSVSDMKGPVACYANDSGRSYSHV